MTSGLRATPGSPALRLGNKAFGESPRAPDTLHDRGGHPHHRALQSARGVGVETGSGAGDRYRVIRAAIGDACPLAGGACEAHETAQPIGN